MTLKKHILKFRERVESIARGAGAAPFFSLETVLLALSLIYTSVMRTRAGLYGKGLFASHRLPCRVVSIGNIIAGGTGKTPMTMMVARLIRDMGQRVVVISRGYRGRMEAGGGVVSDGRTIVKGPEDAGDEPYLMARTLKDIPVVVGRRRVEAGRLAIERFKPDVIVLDDAFQHLRLKRDLDLVLMDSRLPVGNGHLLPRGLLREPLSALMRAHALILTRSDVTHLPAVLEKFRGQLPVFSSAHIPVIKAAELTTSGLQLTDFKDLDSLKDRKAVAFSGLAHNDQFFDSLIRIGFKIVHTCQFNDHHRYTAEDMDGIVDMANRWEADLLITSLKDAVKLKSWDRWPDELIVVDVAARLLDGEARFKQFVTETLGLPATPAR
jgi:tetraacyldisaccharide 4'-kinase